MRSAVELPSYKPTEGQGNAAKLQVPVTFEDLKRINNRRPSFVSI